MPKRRLGVTLAGSLAALAITLAACGTGSTRQRAAVVRIMATSSWNWVARTMLHGTGPCSTDIASGSIVRSGGAPTPRTFRKASPK